jgi:isochorismate hydrolase
MKQAYFTSKTIEAQAKKFLDEVERRNAAGIGERKMALLGLDLQEYFLNPASHAFVPSAPAIMQKVVGLGREFKSAGLPVIYTQHLNRPEDAGMMGSWWQDLITPDHSLAGLSAELDLDGAEVIQKTQYDAFYQTDLAEHLKAQDVEDVVICGVMTHLCCETTARSAFMRGFRVWFPVDATASYNVDFHLGTVRNLAHGFATPVLTAEVLKAL